MRKYKDTQIYKVGKPTEKELKFIKDYNDYSDDFETKNDGYWYAFSFKKHNQEENDEWGWEIVRILNIIGEIYEGQEGKWWLGDLEEEYVYD